MERNLQIIIKNRKREFGFVLTKKQRTNKRKGHNKQQQKKKRNRKETIHKNAVLR